MRTVDEIVRTGAYNSDESERVRQAGYVWESCAWCGVKAYARDHLCPPCYAEAIKEPLE